MAARTRRQGLATPPEGKRANDRLSRAVHRNRRFTKEGMRERLFTLAFRGLVYPQIWEDPLVDLKALNVRPSDRIVTIASGGCNAMSYLTADPARITAVDLNRAHIALNNLKTAAARYLPNYEAFYRFFGEANASANVAAYHRYIEAYLDGASQDYWQSRDLLGRRRINFFARNVYRYGLLGTFIGAGHMVARLHGCNPRRMLEANTLAEQRQLYDEVLAPLFRKRHIRWLANKPLSLYGLGIPPSQFRALTSSGDGDMAQVLNQRLQRLACDFELNDNYFAWQAFARRYAGAKTGALPPYLERENYEVVRDRAERIMVEHISFTEHLAQQPDRSSDCYVLLDAQDWMTDAQLAELWCEITRTARPGARVIFRTAAEPSILPGRVPSEILRHWAYDHEQCRALTRQDRSSIYGGFHLYTLRGDEK
ncbi:MAG: DUF3419 family protein [Hyphomicrobiaceae bacterium]